MSKGLRFLLGLVPAHVVALITVNTYFSYVLAMVLIFGLAFELPLVMVILNVAGVLTHAAVRQVAANDHLRRVRVRGGRHAEP